LERDGSEYFGPYANVVMMYTLTDLIKALYPIRNCNFNLSEANIEAGKFKACMEFQIGNCKAPCIGKQDEADYNLTISQIRHILKGNLSEVNKHLKTHMLAAAEELKFEQAAAFKKKLELLESYQSKSTIVNPMIKDVDVFSISTDDKFAFISYLKVANGIIIQTRTFEIRKRMDESPEELLQFAIAEVRDKYQSLTKEIIVPFDINLKTDEWIFQVPKVGDKKKLLDLATKNAMYYKKEKLVQYEQLDPSLKTDRILKQMQTDLRLKDLPKHIECFDNSNIQGTNAVSACVVFKDARPSKKDYRHFNVKTVDGPNDFDTMREVVYRRYKRVLDENEALPDLIVIDGGKGQLSSAVDSLKSLGIYGKVPILGIAKRLEELFFPEDELPLYIDKKSETLRIIQQIRDEAHRFGITHHRNRRSKEAVKSELTNIDGVGEATMQKVLTVLKSVKKVKESGLEELTEIVGKQKAELIFRYFHP
jgi:excinuclease ABC subunit C